VSCSNPQKERDQLRTMPWWISVIGLGAVAVGASATTAWLLSIAGHNAELRIEAIKVGLSVGAGVGGAVALVLAVRRQWLSERTQAHTEDVSRATQAHLEAVAQDNAYDATQRRVTELYGKAVEQLGHANAAVRLGGLYSLERLAQDHDQHRQTVVDVICAYLRMPFEPPHPALSPDHHRPTRDGDTSHHADDIRQELQVRLAAQRLLARHLAMPETKPSVEQPVATPNSYWAKMLIDLSGSHLIDLDLSYCHLHHADFRAARLSGYTGFKETRFSGDARFRGARFNGYAGFKGTQFVGAAVFGRAEFRGDAWFGGARFGGDAVFGGVRFSSDTGFGEALFDGNAWFGGAEFSGDATFGKARFSGDAGFGDAQFGGDAWFGEARFDADAGFGKAHFRGYAGFGESQFEGDAMFGGAYFRYAEFGGARFAGNAGFKKAKFDGDTGFVRAQFCGNAEFSEARFDTDPDFLNATASHPNDRHTWPNRWQVEQSSSQRMAPLVYGS
jgi:uncharacterized protein YjbI with pentapeptide repeats